MGVEFTVIDPSDLDALARALERPTSLFFSESPTNPYLRVVDIRRATELCHAKDAIVVIDSTFASPINQRALELGADLVLHSGTKYLGGHNDVMAGALVGRSGLIRPIRELNGILGPVIDPHAAYLLLRGMKTLAIRVERQNRNALALARWLEQQPAIDRVHYPGLESHPDFRVAGSQMSGFGCVVSFEVHGDLQAASKFVDALRLPYIAPSLAGVESLVSCRTGTRAPRSAPRSASATTWCATRAASKRPTTSSTTCARRSSGPSVPSQKFAVIFRAAQPGSCSEPAWTRTRPR
jgi:cystathionine gamma-synthase